MVDDAFKASWRRHFAVLLPPYSKMLETLGEAVAKLDAARGYLESLSPEVAVEQEHGLFVAEVAARYGLQVLEHFGLVDGSDPPMPINLAQARQAIDKLLSTVRGYVELGRQAADDSSVDDRADEAVASQSDAGEAPASKFAELIVDPTTFSVRYKGKECRLGNTKAFHLMERLSRTRGTYLSISTLMSDVWKETSPEAGTVQKTVSNLRKKLTQAGIGDLIVIDGTQSDHYSLELH